MHNPKERPTCIRKDNKCYTYYMYFHQSLFHVQVNSHVHTNIWKKIRILSNSKRRMWRLISMEAIAINYSPEVLPSALHLLIWISRSWLVVSLHEQMRFCSCLYDDEWSCFAPKLYRNFSLLINLLSLSCSIFPKWIRYGLVGECLVFIGQVLAHNCPIKDDRTFVGD